ncbi:hypothetical protein [Streptomyces malaysiensis]|uniref:hypothetical protein n=1 Tax=Streptomyces malaysiensis TaxID=92644 RepID=UPI00368272EA
MSHITEALVDTVARTYSIDHADAAPLVNKAVKSFTPSRSSHQDVAALYLRVTVDAALAGEQWARRILPSIRKKVL